MRRHRRALPPQPLPQRVRKSQSCIGCAFVSRQLGDSDATFALAYAYIVLFRVSSTQVWTALAARSDSSCVSSHTQTLTQVCDLPSCGRKTSAPGQHDLRHDLEFIDADCTFRGTSGTAINTQFSVSLERCAFIDNKVEDAYPELFSTDSAAGAVYAVTTAFNQFRQLKVQSRA